MRNYEFILSNFQNHIEDIELSATWGIAELGIAGPTGSAYGHEPGNSVIAVSGPVEAAVKINTGHNNRARNMEEFTDRAFQLLRDVLLN